MNIVLDDNIIRQMLDERVDELLKERRRELASIDIKQLSEITSLSRSTLLDKVTCEPEIVEVTRRIGTRVVYLYPEVMEAYKKCLDRKYMEG